jgi:signal transduction histidine kinase
MQWLYHSSIRTRLLVTYIGFILVGFSVLTVIAASQIQTAIQADYEQHLQDEIRLLALNISTGNNSQHIGLLGSGKQNQLLKQAVVQPNAQLKLYPPTQVAVAGNNSVSQKTMVQPEIKAAVRARSIVVAGRTDAAGGAVDTMAPLTVVVRKSNTGQDAFYTAIPVVSNDKEVVGILQLSVPTRDLLGITMRYWTTLGIGFLLLTTCALLAALLLARSITRPLYQLRSSALRLSQGDLAHRITFTGVDEIAEVAKAFNEMAQRVQKMLEEQRAFASNASHELRTPLTAIRLRTEALRYDTTFISASSNGSGKDTDSCSPSHAERGTHMLKTSGENALGICTVRQYIEEIDDEVVHLSNLVEELILLSQFEAGRAEIGQEQIDLTRMATALIRQFAPRAEASRIELSLTTPETPVLVAANLSHLNVVFGNLLENALKYTTTDHGCVTWIIRVEEDEVHCVMQDSGRGIAAQEIPHLFERFYRVDKARSRAIPGTGLGLAIVKSIVDAHHGRVLVESEGINQGTTVHVYWPCQQIQ